MDVGTRVEFIGYPSYLQGKKGEVIKNSPIMDDMFIVDFDDGTGVITAEQHVKVIEDE